MFNRTFWNFVSAFVFILLISFSLLTFFGAYKGAKETVSALLEGYRGAAQEHQ